MRYAGSAQSWSIGIDQWSQTLELPLWIRAAERIPVPAGGVVPGPLDVDPQPAQSTDTDPHLLCEGWLYWWNSMLHRPVPPPERRQEWLAAMNRFVPPDFAGLDHHPQLQRIARDRWSEANAWHSARKRAGIRALEQGGSRRENVEGALARAVEEQLGHRLAPFEIRLIVLPVLEDEIRSVGGHTFLVPERIRGTETYDRWMRRLIDALG